MQSLQNQQRLILSRKGQQKIQKHHKVEHMSLNWCSEHFKTFSSRKLSDKAVIESKLLKVLQSDTWVSNSVYEKGLKKNSLIVREG